MDAFSPGASSGDDRYRIIEKIGAGAYGNVYKALDLVDHEIVAIKEIKLIASKDGLPLSLIREIRCLKNFKHKNIVGYKGSFRNRNRNSINLVLEYCENDLRSLFASGYNFTVDQVRSIMYQLLKGLEYMHSNNVAHRDIKPGNILILDGEYVKIADFGLSVELNNHQNTSKVATFPYRAPELILGSREYSHTVDIWSAGIIFYELVTGERFPSKPTDLGMLDAIFRITGTPTDGPLSELPNWRLASLLRVYPRQLEAMLMAKTPHGLEEAAAIVSAMLSVDPSDRPSASALLESPLFTLQKVTKMRSLPVQFAQAEGKAPGESGKPSPTLELVRPQRTVLLECA